MRSAKMPRKHSTLQDQVGLILTWPDKMADDKERCAGKVLSC